MSCFCSMILYLWITRLTHMCLLFWCGLSPQVSSGVTCANLTRGVFSDPTSVLVHVWEEPQWLCIGPRWPILSHSSSLLLRWCADPALPSVETSCAEMLLANVWIDHVLVLQTSMSLHLEPAFPIMQHQPVVCNAVYCEICEAPSVHGVHDWTRWTGPPGENVRFYLIPQ